MRVLPVFICTSLVLVDAKVAGGYGGPSTNTASDPTKPKEKLESWTSSDILPLIGYIIVFGVLCCIFKCHMKPSGSGGAVRKPRRNTRDDDDYREDDDDDGDD